MPFITPESLGVAAFAPRWPWFGGDLQTIRNNLLRADTDLSDFPSQRLRIDANDGTGDQLAAVLNTPKTHGPHPTVLLVHGLTGDEDSANIKASTAFFLSQGHAVIRINMRGSGPSAASCRFHYHAGKTGDLATIFAQIPEAFRSNGLYAMGVSLGGNVLLKYLAEAGTSGPVRAAVAISPPVDLKAAQLRIMTPRNRLYHWHLLRAMKADLQGRNIAGEEIVTAALPSIRTVYDFDHRIVAPLNGFTGADDYYARSSALRLLPEIKVPTLIIHPRNDPWVPFAPLESAPLTGTPVNILAPDDGGHVGFHARHNSVPWHNLCAWNYLRQH